MSTLNVPYFSEGADEFLQLAGADWDLLRRMFVPHYYTREVGLSDDTEPDEAYQHFIEHGIQSEVSPSPLFQPHVYEAQERVFQGKKASGDFSSANMPAIVRWLKHPRRSHIVPTVRFDKTYYLCAYPDVAANAKSPFEHFVLNGIWEGRRPHPLFDPPWYARVVGLTDQHEHLPPYLHFLIIGYAQGLPPAQILTPILADRQGNCTVYLDNIDSLFAASSEWLSEYSAQQFEVLISLFVPHRFHHRDVSSDNADGITQLIQFLKTGASRGESPGPFFEPDKYRENARAAGLPLSCSANALFHFLKEGIKAHIVPNAIFDEALYLEKNPDVASSSIWGFAHFIIHGIYEGRRIDNRPMLTIADEQTKALQNWRCFWAAHSDLSDLTHVYLNDDSLSAAQQRMTTVLESKIFNVIYQRALSLDPSVGELEQIREFLVPPIHDPLALVHQNLRARFPATHYDTIVCVPWIRMGGADLVAGLLCGALRALRPEDRILLLRTDQPHLDRPDWLPDTIDIVGISDLFTNLPQQGAQHLLHSAFLGLAPKRIFNVNSRLCWTTFKRFGERLSRQVYLYAYFFCWDQTPSGVRVGYPSEFYTDTARFLMAVFTDTDYLKSELVRIYDPPPAMRDRIIPLYSPTRSTTADPVVAVAGVDSAATRPRPLVLWAGRLDRQKRFDLLVSIARKMPHVDFRCWGAALLDAPPDLSDLPANVKMERPFHSFNELPLDRADAWLFTSAWEGMPTILIELGAYGMPVVASAVGGVSELVNEETGWPVDAIDDTDDYVTALSSALAAPEERVVRARRLQQRVRSRYSQYAYQRTIYHVLTRETLQ